MPRVPAVANSMDRPIRVLVVDDSVVARHMVTKALSTDTQLVMAGSAANGVLALEKVERLSPDVVTLDIEMPEMDGFETLRHLRARFPNVKVIMFSTLTQQGAAATIEALILGASDYVAKPSNTGSLAETLSVLRASLIPRIKQHFTARASMTAPAGPHWSPGPMRTGFRVVAIGCSTGGPAALSKILGQLPASFPLPVLVVQHMPPLFTQYLASSLQARTSLRVREAAHGDPVEPGVVLIAPGNQHMRLVTSDGTVRIELDQSPPMHSCRPAVDALFESVATVYGPGALALILTGMGRDGQRGAEVLKSHGAYIIAQDEATSVVWGMPGAVVQGGLADSTIPLPAIAAEVTRLSCRRRG